jgi:UrcA family protein
VTLMGFASVPTSKLSPGALADANGRKIMMKSGLFILGLAFAATATAQPPQTRSPVRSEQVVYADLNFAQPTAQSTLQERIRAAAGRVCELGGMQALEDFSTSSRCYRSAVADGYRQLNQLIASNRPSSAVAVSAIVITAR